MQIQRPTGSIRALLNAPTALPSLDFSGAVAPTFDVSRRVIEGAAAYYYLGNFALSPNSFVTGGGESWVPPGRSWYVLGGAVRVSNSANGVHVARVSIRDASMRVVRRWNEYDVQGWGQFQASGIAMSTSLFALDEMDLVLPAGWSIGVDCGNRLGAGPGEIWGITLLLVDLPAAE